MTPCDCVRLRIFCVVVRKAFCIPGGLRRPHWWRNIVSSVSRTSAGHLV